MALITQLKIFTLLSFIIVTLFASSSHCQFVWNTTRWADCDLIDSWQHRSPTNSTCCRLICGQTRHVTCLRQRDQLVVPTHYCQHTSRPPSFQSCTSCSQSTNCIVSVWSDWSPCSTTCGSGFQSRRRQILALPNHRQLDGCPSTFQQQPCYNILPCNQSKSLQTSVMWKSQIGQCEEYIIEDVEVKLRQGGLICIDSNGNYISDRFCTSPTTSIRTIYEEVCYPEVDCLVSDWDDWDLACQGCANASVPTSFMQRRIRRILRYPANGGQACPLLFQDRLCILPKCATSRYKRLITEWGECVLDSSIKNSSPGCKMGTQRRSLVCINEDTNTIVDIKFCQSSLTDIGSINLARGCSVNCSQDCLPSPWSTWSNCSTNCGIGITTRYRSVIIPAVNGGKDCGILNQIQTCNQNNCSYWRTDAWSKCLPDQLNSQCGRGTSLRSIYCVSYNGNPLGDGDCNHLPRPPRARPCLIPCLDDCILSEWTTWSDCHNNCSNVSKRHRYLLGTGQNCNSVDNLQQTRNCNDCSKSQCTVGPWGLCLPKRNGTCGNNQGFRSRPVNCSLISNISAPSNTQDCNIPCPVDCRLSTTWTAWSACSQSCGDGYSTRMKFVIQYAHHGGRPCPSNVTMDGVVLERRPCDLPQCQNATTYQWVTQSWSLCKLLQDNSSMICGNGIQIRQVNCISNNHVIVDHELCINNSLLNAPAKFRPCSIPCKNDCTVTPWSPWSKCSSNCNQYRDIKIRNRYFHNFNKSVGLDLCKHIKNEDLTQVANCFSDQCFTYKWLISKWQSCVLTSANVTGNDRCGTGIQKRSILCERSDNNIVDDELCVKYMDTVPANWRTCTIDCGTDCQMTQWSVWSDCDQECGYGIKRRNRHVSRYASANAKQCGHLEESEVCQRRPCHGITWFTGAWSQCVLNNGSVCGHGLRNRNVYCIDSSQKSIPKQLCSILTPQPISVEPCQVTCANQCGYSMWSDWTPCSETCSRGSRRRTRYLLRDISGSDCTDTVEAEACIVNSCHNYYWTVSSWTRCLPIKPLCGKGVQFRAINCQRSDGVVVSPSLCSKNTLPAMRDCHVTCDTDCILSEWSSWSSCSADCGLHGKITRQRRILYNATGTGKPCPQQQNLHQSQPCSVKPCFTYTIIRNQWSRCITIGSECGHGNRYRAVSCIRNDGAEVDISKCITTLIKANQASVEFSLKDSTLDVSTTGDCYIPCKGDCVSTTWSNYSPCYYDCNNGNNIGYRVRTRQIINQAKIGGLPCPDNMVDIIQCLPSEARCANFQWRTGKWSVLSGEREVWCIDSTNGRNVSGCSKLTMPPTNIQCEPECSEAYSECRDGQCSCIVSS